MARILFAPVPFTGHVNPGLPIARELASRGHEVLWYATPPFRAAVEKAGARYVPFHFARRLDELRLAEQFPDRPKLGGIRQLKYDLERVFVDFAPGALRDLEALHNREPLDLLIGDNAALTVAMAAERLKLRWAVYGMNVLITRSRDTAPFGLALMPSSSPLGRLRNSILNWTVDNIIFRDTEEHHQKVRRDLGFGPSAHRLFELSRDANVYLQGSVEAFEYPRTDMPANVRFIGGFLPSPPVDWTPPPWWGELEGKRVVLLTQGTINSNFDHLIHPAIRVLADEDVMVIVTTGSKSPDAVTVSLPANVRVERFIPYGHLMPKVDLLLTNGGYGSIQIALAHGVPVVAFGKSEDKAEIANRVTWSGVGIGVKTDTASETQVRDSVRTVLSDSRYRRRAEEISRDMAERNAPVIAAELLEGVIKAEGQDEFAA